MRNRDTFEIIIVGCGIAGASLAYFLTERGAGDVLILEREEQPGYHSTGRSAARLVTLDPVPSMFQLLLTGASFLREPPAGFSDSPLLEQPGNFIMFQGPMWDMIKELAPFYEQSGIAIELLSPSEAVNRIPVVSPEHMDGAVFLPNDGHIDVHGLLWSYLRHARQKGADLRCGVEVQEIRVERGQCCGVITNAGEFRARKVVNAAGAWAGVIGKLAGAANIEFTPKRRTIITFDAPDDLDVKGWPHIANYSHRLFFGPESGGLLASPMDEDPMEPCDARPDDLLVAQTIERIEKLVPRLLPRSLKSKWAGLRTYSPDLDLVVGEDPLVRGFYWIAGHGGSGIETSPAVGQFAADLIMDGSTDRIDASVFAPGRFRNL
jgi:D-arginine dehydrogenase